MQHEFYLIEALKEAQKRRGFCAPNPAVGAILVHNAEIISRGYHYAAGQPHAEVACLENVSRELLQQATLYVSLEPCSHHGRTPPCTDLIIASGIRKVVYAYRDPNPKVLGQGEKILRQAGIEVIHLAIPAIDDFYSSYQYWLKTKRPKITAKMAISFDAKIAGPKAQPITITNPALGIFTHQQRQQHDAILTTATTVINDNPQMNVRLQGQTQKKPVYVIDRQRKIPTSVQLFNTAEKLTLFYDRELPMKGLGTGPEDRVECIPIESSNNQLNLEEIVNVIGQQGIHDLWVEAGGKLLQSLLEAQMLQRCYIYIAAKLLGQEAHPAFHAHSNFLAHAKKIQWHVFDDNAICQLDWE
jgi:diaminohydroxyphosphoribosylaminopyrimidine deaminase/5-amino-6-(5-phosphoribosylamino)uracil reductase